VRPAAVSPRKWRTTAKRIQVSVERFSPILLRSALALLAFAVSTSALTLSIPFGSHMVLQRGMKVPVWGKGTASEASRNPSMTEIVAPGK
jgi:hypothetical protein